MARHQAHVIIGLALLSAIRNACCALAAAVDAIRLVVSAVLHRLPGCTQGSRAHCDTAGPLCCCYTQSHLARVNCPSSLIPGMLLNHGAPHGSQPTGVPAGGRQAGCNPGCSSINPPTRSYHF